jgi:nicotinamidase-related amidase
MSHLPEGSLSGKVDRKYAAHQTGILLIDPYNDFLAEAGKLHAPARAIAEANGMLGHMRDIVALARSTGIRVFYVPHHRAQPTDFAGWSNPTPYQLAGHKVQAFAVGTWGGEWHAAFVPQPDDVIVKEHWSSGFAGTDLDLQLRQRGVQKIILVGMLANTCLEATGRYGMELGYEVTLVRDATAAFSAAAMQCAHDINGPTYAHAIVTTDELMQAIRDSQGA